MLDLAFQPTLPSVCLSCLPPAEYEFEVSSRRPPIRESVDRSDNFHPLFHSIIYTRGGRKVISTTFVYSSMKIDNEETLRSSWNDFSLSLSRAHLEARVTASNLIAIVAAIMATVEVASGHFLKIAINPSAQSATNPCSSLINLNESRDKHHRFPLQISKNSYQVNV